MEGARSPLISLGGALTWWSLTRPHHQHLSRCTLPRYVRGQPVRLGIQEAAALPCHCCLLSGNRPGRLSQQPRLPGAACFLCVLEKGAVCCAALSEGSPDCLLQVNQPKWGTQTVKLSWVLESCRRKQHLPEQGFQVALPPVRVSCVCQVLLQVCSPSTPSADVLIWCFL